MKVLYITNSGGWGGASVALKNIWDCLDKYIDIYAVFPDKGTLSEYAETRKYKCYYIPYKLDIWPNYNSLKRIIAFVPKIIRNSIRQYFGYKKLCRIITEAKPDIVHTNVGPIQIAACAAKKCNVPHVWHLREYQVKDFKMHPFPSFNNYKLKLREENNSIIAITKDVKDYFQLQKKYNVIYDGVVSKQEPIPTISFETSNYFLFVGRLEDTKGWKDALVAFLKIANDYPDVNFLFAGKYVEKDIEYIKDTLIPTNLLDRIKFLGFRTDCDSLMRNAKALIVPSMSEGFGFITVEGMYNGCIIIGRNTGGTKEQFDNGMDMFGTEIGIRFETNEELILQMKYVLSKDKTYFKDMLENAQHIVIEKYSIEKNAEEILSVYNKLFQNGKVS